MLHFSSVVFPTTAMSIFRRNCTAVCSSIHKRGTLPFESLLIFSIIHNHLNASHFVTVQKDIYKSRERRRGRIQYMYRKEGVLALSGDTLPSKTTSRSISSKTNINQPQVQDFNMITGPVVEMLARNRYFCLHPPEHIQRVTDTF